MTHDLRNGTHSGAAATGNVAAVVDPFRPSEYTALLIHALRSDPARIEGTSVLEIGSGSGVVLAALGALGAASLCGIDIEQEAIRSGASLLHSLGYSDTAEFHLGDMWQPVAGRRFDLIVANLPHFPGPNGGFNSRLPSWSGSGVDGRDHLDRLVNGLAEHLTRGGRAIITHNAFVDLVRTRDMAASQGLALRVVATTMLPLPEDKADRMTESVRRAEATRSIHCFGHYVFVDVHIVEIRPSGAIG